MPYLQMVGDKNEEKNKMEKRLKRIEILLIVLTILTIANMATLFFFNKQSEISEEVEKAESRDLPDDLTREVNDKTVYRIKSEFNLSNWEELYNVFGEYAKAQIRVENIEREFVKLKPVTGNIKTYTYSHHVYEGEGEGADWFDIYYKCRFDHGKGTIKVSTRTVNGVSEVIGINIVLDEL